MSGIIQVVFEIKKGNHYKREVLQTKHFITRYGHHFWRPHFIISLIFSGLGLTELTCMCVCAQNKLVAAGWSGYPGPNPSGFTKYHLTALTPLGDAAIGQ